MINSRVLLAKSEVANSAQDWQQDYYQNRYYYLSNCSIATTELTKALACLILKRIRLSDSGWRLKD